jgi:tetratricopeptide (TPR) repeat protein
MSGSFEIPAIAAVLFGLGGVVLISPQIRPLPAFASGSGEAEVVERLSPEVERAIVFGYEAVAADIWWLDGIQYYGTPANTKDRFRSLSSFLDVTTDFDPAFEYVYQFGGQAIPFHDPETHLWYNIPGALRLLRKGVAAGGQRWQVPWLLGYTLYTYRGEYEEAGQAMAEASRRRGAPSYIQSLADRLLAQADDPETAIELTKSAMSQTQDPKVLAELSDQLRALELQRDLDVLNDAANRLRKTGVTPSRLEDLLPPAGLAALPPEPYEGHFYWDAAAGKVKSNHDDKLLRLRIYPGHPPVERTAD